MSTPRQHSPKAPPTSLDRAAATWFLAQAVCAAAWWAILFFLPEARRYFLPADAPDVTLLAFVAPDMVLYVGGALVAAYGLARAKLWSLAAILVHTGAAAYAALFCLALSFLSNAAWLGTALMFPAASITCFMAWRLAKARRSP